MNKRKKVFIKKRRRKRVSFSPKKINSDGSKNKRNLAERNNRELGPGQPEHYKQVQQHNMDMELPQQALEQRQEPAPQQQELELRHNLVCQS
jgi:hypothetical protein